MRDFPDLVVGSISTPATVSGNSSFTITYQIQNSGLAPATGDWQQVLYLSPDSTLDANAVPVDTYDFNGTLPAGLNFDRTVTVQSPAQVGTYYAIVVTNANDTIVESDATNNTTVSPAIAVTAAYTATVSTSVTTALAGTVIPLTGHASNATDGSPAVYKAVDIHIGVRSTDRVISAITDVNGNFTAQFTPLPGEAGDYTIGAAYAGAPTAPVQGMFTLLGISASSAGPRAAHRPGAGCQRDRHAHEPQRNAADGRQRPGPEPAGQRQGLAPAWRRHRGPDPGGRPDPAAGLHPVGH